MQLIPAPDNTTMFLYLLEEMRSATHLIASGTSSEPALAPMETLFNPSVSDEMSSSFFDLGSTPLFALSSNECEPPRLFDFPMTVYSIGCFTLGALQSTKYCLFAFRFIVVPRAAGAGAPVRNLPHFKFGALCCVVNIIFYSSPAYQEVVNVSRAQM